MHLFGLVQHQHLRLLHNLYMGFDKNLLKFKITEFINYNNYKDNDISGSWQIKKRTHISLINGVVLYETIKIRITTKFQNTNNS